MATFRVQHCPSCVAFSCASSFLSQPSHSHAVSLFQGRPCSPCSPFSPPQFLPPSVYPFPNPHFLFIIPSPSPSPSTLTPPPLVSKDSVLIPPHASERGEGRGERGEGRGERGEGRGERGERSGERGERSGLSNMY